MVEKIKLTKPRAISNKEQIRLKKLYANQEKKDLLQLGILLDAFNSIEYQIDELIAVFYGRYEIVGVFIDNINPYLRFSDKTKILGTILNLDDVKKFRQLSKKDFKFMERFQSIRNVIAHGSYIPRDGESPSCIFVGSTKHVRMFNLSDKNQIKKIKTESLRIARILLEINLHFCEQRSKTKKLPVIKQSAEKWLDI